MLKNTIIITADLYHHLPAGSDYNLADATVDIPKNDLQACFSVEIVDDTAEEDNMENFFVDLVYLGTENVTVGPQSSTEVIVLG